MGSRIENESINRTDTYPVDPDRIGFERNGILYPAGGRRGEDVRFVEEYRRIRREEGRGSDDREYYLRLPDGDFDGVRGSEWRERKRSLRWLERHLDRRRRNDLTVVDAGSGNCWLSHRLAVRGACVIAVDVDDDDYDGLGAGRHYLGSGMPPFLRICSGFESLPLRSASIDLLVYNGSLHYAEDLFAVIAEGVRTLRPEGEIVIMDSPLYRNRTDGDSMVAERGGPVRGGYLLHDELRRVADRLGLGIRLHRRSRSPAHLLRRLVWRIRLGREPASMPWIVLQPHRRSD